jgi:glycosyltransferase involved in cell wall biosynthesis
MIDIIICTYNRPKKVLDLVSSLLLFKVFFNRIIVVDSSDKTNEDLLQIEDVLYLKSSHKNQPYQRYLGFLSAASNFLLFLDDDMELVDDQIFKRIVKYINEIPDLSGIAINFKDKHSHSTLNEIPKSVILKNSGTTKKFVKWLTGIPELENGHLGFCGNRGVQPNKGGKTQWVSGGAFLARKSLMFQNFNFQMFEIFEKRLGMGEDAIIGYGLSQKGSLIFDPGISFLHNDQRDSSYSVDIYTYARRVMYSRLYLSLEIQRISLKPLSLARIHFHYYAFCRILGASINLILTFKKKNFLYIKGMISGYILTYKFKFNKVNEAIF